MRVDAVGRRAAGRRIAWLLSGLAALAAPGADAATRVYYSVGTSRAVPTDLKAGAPTVTITAGVATFTVAQPNNVGVGDEVMYGGATLAYISGRISSTQYTVTNRLGAAPANVVGATVNRIYRAFASLSLAVANSSNGTHLGTTVLTGAGNYQLNWPCYADGVMTLAPSAEVAITGYTTGPSNYIRVYTPVSGNEVGVSQRHRGVWGTGFQLQGTNADTIQIEDEYVRVEGLTIQSTVTAAGAWGAIYSIPSAASDIRISHNIIRGVVTAGNPAYGIALGLTAADVSKVFNNVIFNVTNTGGAAYGIGITIDQGFAYVFNNTIYNCETGIRKYPSAAGAEVRNNVAIHNTVANPGYVDYDQLGVAPAAVRSNNVSSDASSETVALRSKTAFATYFRNTTAGSEDLHITSTSLALWGSSGVNLSTDPNAPVTDDIDSGPRLSPDIGADEFGVCCDLDTAEVPGSTVTVTGAGQFELRFNAALGGGIDRFFDLAEDPARAYDIGGGVSDQRLLFEDEIVTSPNYNYPEDPRGSLSLLEATSTRVKVRQDASYFAAGGGAQLASARGTGDYAIYPPGRMAIAWKRRTTAARAYSALQLNFTARYGAVAPYSGWADYAESGYMGASQPASDDFVLLESDSSGVRTDFLGIMHADWTGAHGAEEVFSSYDSGLNFLTEATWQRYTGGTLPAGAGPFSTQTGEVFNFLTYFKPTNFADNLDPAVTSRRDDYRTAATPVINGGKGTQWQDAVESSGTGGDFYNEGEAAYVFNLDPTLGLDFNLSGVGTTRYAPFFKIRQWRSVVPPQTITVDGATRTRNVHYKADVKPVTFAALVDEIRWHSTLESAAALSTTPDVGSPGGASAGVSYVAARYGSGLYVPNNNDYFTLPTGSGFDKAAGALEFWFQPTWASGDGVRHDIAGSWVNASNQFLLQKLADNTLRFTIVTSAGTSDLVITSANYGWLAGDWVHIIMQWGDSLTLAGQQQLYVNGIAPAHTDPVVDYNSALLTLDTDFYIGNISGIGSSAYADGIYDEVYAYSLSAQDPSAGLLARGGLTSSPSEFLGSPTANAALSLSPLNGTRQGEYLYLGSDARFRGLNVVLATAGAGTATLQWQYWNGTAWANLEAVTGFTDLTNDLKRNGNVYWTADPAGWSPLGLAAGPDLYYVRVHVASGSYTTSPVEYRITTDILLFQNCGDVTTNSNFVFAPPVTTEVKLQSFTAAAGDRSVRLEWRTASELDNLGFHLYRGLSASGPWTQLTASLIPGLGSSATGQAYAFSDGGLENGTRYFYLLEDVDARSRATRHGPVSAVPAPGAVLPAPAGNPAPGGASSQRRDTLASASCPGWVVTAYASLAGRSAADKALACTRHGDADSVSLAVVSRDARQATLELRTGGFWSVREPSGRVRVFVPGFDFPQDEEAPALPVRRAFVDAVVGRRVQLGGVRALEQAAYPGLAPVSLGRAEMELSQDGTVAAGRRRPRELAPRHVSVELARLLPSVFQGEAKSAVVEIAPLRFDERRGRLLLARRVLVKLLFTGRETGESGRGSLGRRERARPAPAGELLARLYTRGRGLHAVSFEQLFPGATGAVKAQQLQLERQGEAVAVHLEPAGQAFGPGGVLYFHADTLPASTDFAPEVAFELRRVASGLRMPLAASAPSGPTVSATATGRAAFESERFYQPGLLDAADPWLWEALPSGATRVTSFSLAGASAPAGRLVELEVSLQGASESGNAVDHHVSVALNGVLAGEAQFAGKRPYRMSLSLDASALRDGSNELALTNVADTGVSSLVFLDHFTLAYPRAQALSGGSFEATFAESGAAELSGVAGPLALVDVTTAPARWLTGYAAAAGSVRFRAEAGRRYLAVSQQGLLAPRVAAAPVASTLREATSQADYLLIAPRAFLSAAARLVERRRDQGLAARAVAFEEIADEFGHGRPSAEAIRGFLAYAYQSWARPSPRYVLLLGDASYDPRNFTGVAQPAPLPALWTRTSYLWTVSDPLLGAVNGEDELPDLAIGRLPATTPEQAQSLVDKLVAWEESGQGLAGGAALVADNPDLAGDFDADVDAIAAGPLAGRDVTRLKLSDLGAAAMRPAIRAALDAGLSLLSYVGHGGAAVWASENVWSTWDAPSLQAQSRQPLLVTMNCLNGYFVAPSYDSLAESLVKAEGRGAIAAFSPSGLSLDAPAHQYHAALVAELASGRHARLGDAVLAAQRSYAASGLMPELLTVYQLLGDPATVVR